MSTHTLALVFLCLYLVSIGIPSRMPVEKKPWTVERRFAAMAGLSATVFLIWLLVRVL